MKIHAWVALVACVCVGAAHIAAQAPAQTFELASVRRSPPAPARWDRDTSSPASMEVLPGGRFEAREQTLTDLARVAYGFEQLNPGHRVVEVAVVKGRFDVTATTDREWTTPPPAVSVPAELRTMLRALLEDRFELKARIETKKVDVTAIRLVRRDGQLGPGLRRSSGACLGPFTEAPRNDPNAKPWCAFTFEYEEIKAGAVTMSELAMIIGRHLQEPVFGVRPDLRRYNRIVVDQTGLEGRFDAAISLRTQAVRDALDTQLGLTLENAKLPIPTLVVERAKAPGD